MPRIIDDGYYDTPFNRRASTRHGYRNSAGGKNFIIGVLAAVVVYLTLQIWNPLSSQTASPKLEAVSKEPPIARDLTNTKHVTVDGTNLYESPSNRSTFRHILPRGVGVIFLGEAHRDLDGNVWLRVIVETREGRQTGWVQEQYIS